MIQILLVDDQELVRAGLRGILHERFGFQIIGECGDGDEVLAAIRRGRPDVVLMDVRMARVDGIGATRALLAQPAAPPVLALTTFDDDQALAGMLRAGAAGFVLKGVPAATLQEAVRAIAAGEAWLDPAVTKRVLDLYRAAPGPPSDATEAIAELTTREREVLGLIGAGFTNPEIAETLVVSAGTVKTHVNHIFSKLDLRNRPAAVIFALEHGLVTREPD